MAVKVKRSPVRGWQALALPWTLLAMLPVGTPAAAFAADNAAPVLPPVTVIGRLANPATGKSGIGAGMIGKLPLGNGTLGDLLTIFPDVQAAEDARSSLAGGEILPPPFSISGGRPYENQVAVDGAGGNSLLDPAADNPLGLNEVPGHPQELFPQADLLESVTVYDSNIPAEFGGFTGGVVDARTRRAGPQPGGRLYHRTTRSGWTKFHVDAGKRYAFAHSGNYDRQPRFEKYEAGIDFDLPLRSGVALLASYRVIDADIPLRHLGGSRSQSRRLENFLVKASSPVGADGLLELSFLHTPYRADYFIPQTRSSDFTVQGGGYQGSLAWSGSLGSGEGRLLAGYRASENSREAPADFRQWAATDNHPWGRLIGSEFSAEGGRGSLDREQKTVFLSGAVDFHPGGGPRLDAPAAGRRRPGMEPGAVRPPAGDNHLQRGDPHPGHPVRRRFPGLRRRQAVLRPARRLRGRFGQRQPGGVCPVPRRYRHPPAPHPASGAAPLLRRLHRQSQSRSPPGRLLRPVRRRRDGVHRRLETAISAGLC